MSKQVFTSLKGAADFMGPGAIEVPIFEQEIFDIVRRTSIALNRLPTMPATGHPHRYFEQTAIATGNFTDPRNISPTPNTPTRDENALYIKALVNQTNLSLFDKDVTQQQGQFSYVVAKDIEDIINGIEVARASALWTGTDKLYQPNNKSILWFLNTDHTYRDYCSRFINYRWIEITDRFDGRKSKLCDSSNRYLC